MTEEIRDKIMGAVCTYISGTLDELHGEVYMSLKDGKMDLEFHDVMSLVEEHLEVAACNIDGELEYMQEKK